MSFKNKFSTRHKVLPYEVIIGIDCGVKTGFAVWEMRNKKLVQVETTSIHTALERVRTFEHYFPKAILVRIEDARQRKWFGNSEASHQKATAKQQGAGSVKRDARIWEDAMTDWEIAFEMVNPDSNKTKVKEDMFQKMTGWDKRTSSHGRDAAMLVFNYG